MFRLSQILNPGLNRTPRQGARNRRRRFGVETLEGRQLMAIDFTSAFGIGGGVVIAQKTALDSQGNTYVTGTFSNKVSFDPGSTGGNVLDAGTTGDAFVAKYSPNNTLLWVKQFADDPTVPGGGSAGNGIAVDNNTGSVYVTGFFSGTVDFDPGGNTFKLTSAGGGDGFIVKLTANGDLDSGLAKRFGGPSDDVGLSVSLDRSGTNVLIAGSYTNSANFDPGGTNTTLTSPTANQRDSFALKLSSNLGFGFAARAGLANSQGSAIAADSQGSVYLVGTQTPGPSNAFIAKYNATGMLAAERVFGGPASGGTAAIAAGVVVDSSNNVYVDGSFSGTGVNFNKFNGPGTVALDSAGATDAFLIKLDPSLTLSFARRFGSTQSDSAKGLAIDANNNVYLAGSESGQSSFGTTGAGTNVLDTGNGLTNVLNAFVLEVDSTGSFVQANGARGTGQSDANSIAVNALGQIAIFGFYNSPASFGTTSLGTLGTTQIYVSRLTTSGGTTGTGTGTGGMNNPPPPPLVAPTFVNATRIVTGKGRHKKVVGFMLNFSGSLGAADAQNVAHYHVTQMARRGRMTAVPVLSATDSAAGNSVSLILGGFKKNKPLQLSATGLTGANGTMVAPIMTTLF
jgi:hypothetical protein